MMRCRAILWASVLVGAFLAHPATSEGDTQGDTPAVHLAVEPLPAASVREIGGFVRRRFRTNRDDDLRSFPIDRYTRLVEEKTWRDWFWIGEQPGKWLESAALTSSV